MDVHLVAAFTDEAFAGNPAGVCFSAEVLEPALMQRIAAELRQPETAFLWPDGPSWSIRWFSPEVEVDLCGHATLAAAAVIFRDRPECTTAAFSATHHDLSAVRCADGMISLDFPASTGCIWSAPVNVLATIDAAPIAAARFGNRWLLEFGDASEVRRLKPDFAALRATGIRSLIATACSDVPDFDIVSRNFAPLVGVDEDQVTGAVHTCLASYWESRLGPRLRCWQASRRGGGMNTHLSGDRVALDGRAVIEFSGRFYL